MKYLNCENKTSGVCILFCLTFMFCGFIAVAQELNPQQYFPSSVGNKWRWEDYEHFTIFDSEITRDSISSDKNRYLFFNNNNTASYIIDTTNRVFQILQGTPVLWYKLDSQPGDSFTTTIYGDLYTVKVTSKPPYFGGNTVPSKEYSWYGPNSDGGKTPYASQRLEYGVGCVLKTAVLGPVDQRVSGYIIDGVGHRTLSEVKAYTDNFPSTFWLDQNFPNPFNPTTTVKFAIPERSHVILNVYDLLGRNVLNIIDRTMVAGISQVGFSMNNIPSGVYLLRLSAGKYFQSKKIILLK